MASFCGACDALFDTAVLTELLSNNATIVIMAPIALALAYEMLGLTAEGQELARAYVLTA